MNNPVIISIDGNIGSGKSTLYTDLQKYYHDRNDICFVPEPVDDWTKIVDGDNTPILTNLYKDTKKYAFRFQMMAYISRLHLLRQKVKENKYRVIISERSVQTDRNVFAKMLFDDGMIEDDEYQIYNQWFDEFLDDMTLGGIIYVRAEPNVCAERVIMRGREGETIPIEYLEKCHQYHEDWLKNSINKITIEANVDTRIKDNLHIREHWLKHIDEWMIKELHITSPNIVSSISNIAADNTPNHVVQFDGACRGNPSNILGLGCVLQSRYIDPNTGNSHDTLIEENSIRYTTINGTNNEAEYMSMINGMELALKYRLTKIVLEGDSMLVINQMTGKNQVKAKNLSTLYSKAKILEQRFEHIQYKHIKREFNKLADSLANKALDEEDTTSCPEYSLRFEENQL
jgi:deoxyadenosine/deoxycytidine kinase/ribonuclease HI